MKRRPNALFSDWQRHLLAELKSIAKLSFKEIRITKSPKLDSNGDALVTICLRTVDLPRAINGLRLQDWEEFVLRIGASSFSLPDVDVDHVRFLGYPHVLQGQRICIYLDPSREWQPRLGMAGLLSRLWEWLEDAANGQFDAKTSLYHAVGGVLHQAPGTPTIVVRESNLTKHHRTAYLIQRSSHRFDLTYSPGTSRHRLPVFMLASDLPYGATTTFAGLLTLMDDPYMDRTNGRAPRVQAQSPIFISSIGACALRNPDGSEQYFILGVPHPSG
jgi:hypothetical protein